MPALNLDHHSQTEITLFRNADHSHRLFQAGEEFRKNTAALIQQAGHFNVARLEQLSDIGSTLLTADFFIMAKGQVNRTLRLKILFEQVLNRFKDANHTIFDVQRTSSPD